MQLRGRQHHAIGFSTFLVVVVACAASPAAATNVSGSCPVGGFTAAGSPWVFTGSVSVPNGTTCTVQAGATLNGNGNGLSVSGTLTAVGTSNAVRNVVFNNVAVGFQPDGTGTLQYCTVNQVPSGAYFTLQGTPTVSNCTITAAGSFGLYAPSGAATISNNTIGGTVSYDIYVGDGAPTISGNLITATSYGIYQVDGTGTVSGNTIGFGGGSAGRVAIYVSGDAAPMVSGNTILDAVGVSDIGISAQVTAPGVQIVNNTINASGGDFPLQITPAVFQAGSQVSGNSFPGGLAAGVTLGGTVTGTATVSPLMPAVGTVVDTYVGQNLSVPSGATLTIAAGVTLNGGTVSVSGTLTAVGTSNAVRNVVFNNVAVGFQPDGTGTLQYCTVNQVPSGAYFTLQGTPTVSNCTITAAGSFGLYAPSGAATISNNTIGGTVSYDIYVGDGAPTISGNLITATSYGIYQVDGTGTVSGNTIGFGGGSAGRVAIYVSGDAAPMVSGNTILDAVGVSDIGISAQVTAPGVQIVNNTINASGGDFPLQITPAVFQAGSQVSGNSFPGGLAAGVTLGGTVTGTATVSPLMPAVGTVVDTYVGQNLSVPSGATLTIAAGVTLNGGTVSVSGTLTAVGTSNAVRNVVFNNVAVAFQPDGTGTLQNCTVNQVPSGTYFTLQGTPTVSNCTITAASSFGLYMPSGAATISNNTIGGTVSYDIYVGDGAHTISGNLITATSYGIYLAGGAGTVSGNGIGFGGGSSGRVAIYVSGSAMPAVSGNTIFDDPTASDTGIRVDAGASNGMTQIINNKICATGGDTFINAPPGFAGTLSGNTNECPQPPTMVPTQSFTPTRTGTTTPTPVATATPSITLTPANTSTRTPTGAVTATNVPTATHTPTGAMTATNAPTATPTLTHTPSSTPTRSATPTATSVHTATHTATATPSIAASATPTPSASITPTPAVTPNFFTVTGQILSPGPRDAQGNRGLVPVAFQGFEVFVCVTGTECLTNPTTIVRSSETDENGRFAVSLSIDIAVQRRFVLIRAILVDGSCRLLITPRQLAAFAGISTSLRTLAGLETGVVLDPISEAASRVLEAAGVGSYTDEGIEAIMAAVDEANAAADFAGLTLNQANDAAESAANNDPTVQTLLRELQVTPTPTPIACVGDCDGGGEVTVDEIIKGVNIALGNADLSTCPVFDKDGNGEVDVTELIVAVNNALAGCAP